MKLRYIIKAKNGSAEFEYEVEPSAEDYVDFIMDGSEMTDSEYEGALKLFRKMDSDADVSAEVAKWSGFGEFMKERYRDEAMASLSAAAKGEASR